MFLLAIILRAFDWYDNHNVLSSETYMSTSWLKHVQRAEQKHGATS